MPKKIIAANWKMHKTVEEAKNCASAIAKGQIPSEREVLIFPPFTCLATVSEAIKNNAQCASGAQNFYPATHGAFTGEIAPAMIKDAGAKWVLIGHSERRHIFGESDDLIKEKVAFALEQKLKPMLCIGETLKEREEGLLSNILERQLITALKPLKPEQFAEIAIAYEPVWAIGTGKVAGPEETKEAHAIVYNILSKIAKEAATMPILYGGSVKADNAKTLLAIEHVDGVLVGGASLEADSFLKIATA